MASWDSSCMCGWTPALKAHRTAWRNMSDVHRLMLAIKPSLEVKRLPRSINMLTYWKATKFRNFLLLHSLVWLRRIEPKDYLHHCFLLHFAVYNLMMKEITRAILALCDVAWHKFVMLVPSLYGNKHVSFNVHLLTHCKLGMLIFENFISRYENFKYRDSSSTRTNAALGRGWRT